MSWWLAGERTLHLQKEQIAIHCKNSKDRYDVFLDTASNT